jgi:hypothetical protein
MYGGRGAALLGVACVGDPVAAALGVLIALYLRAIGICAVGGVFGCPVCRSSVVARFWGIVARALAVLLGGFPSRLALSRGIFASVGFWRVRGCNCWALGLPCACGRFLSRSRLRLCCAWLCAVRLAFLPRRVPYVAVIAPRGRPSLRVCPSPIHVRRRMGGVTTLTQENEYK